MVGSRLGSEPPGHQYRRGDPTELRDHPETEAHQFTVVHVGLYRASQSKCDSGCETGPAPPPALAPSSLLSDQAAMLPRAPSAGKTPFPSAPPPPVFSPPSPSPTVFPSLPGYVRLALDVSQVSHFLSVREQTAWVTEQSPILSAVAHTFIHRGVETLLRQEQNAQSDCA